MSRHWSENDFKTLWETYICQDVLQPNARDYYKRYRSRYRLCLKLFSELVPDVPVDLLDIGIGQLALMSRKMWLDNAVVADLPGPHLNYMQSHDVKIIHWNLCKLDYPFSAMYDVIFFSEVIEHLPVPGHVVLERLRKILKPGGLIICITPNLYRLRNVVYMALGKPIFDYFRVPEGDIGLSHVIEYSRDHLRWQLEKAGFVQCHVEYCQMHHSPAKPLHRPFAWLGYPLHLIPRWRDNLMAIGYAPAASSLPAP